MANALELGSSYSSSVPPSELCEYRLRGERLQEGWTHRSNYHLLTMSQREVDQRSLPYGSEYETYATVCLGTRASRSLTVADYHLVEAKALSNHVCRQLQVGTLTALATPYGGVRSIVGRKESNTPSKPWILLIPLFLHTATHPRFHVQHTHHFSTTTA
jgi:hypothetical protein